VFVAGSKTLACGVGVVRGPPHLDPTRR
jgi:hypothetical protein